MTYRELCAARGMSLHHTDEWSAADREAFYRWKLENFRELWKAYKADGTTRLVSHEWLRSRIRESLDRLYAPPSSRPYTGQCDCHPRVYRQDKPEPEPAHGLAWMAATFGRRR